MGRECKAAVGLGASCATNASCASNRCNTVPGNPKKCIPNDGTGRDGDYCTHNNQSRGGYRCDVNPGRRSGHCRR